MKKDRGQQRLYSLFKKISVRPYFLSALIFLCIGFLAWRNHRDFVRVMVRQSEEQILLVAQIQAQFLQHRMGDVEDTLRYLSEQEGIRALFTSKGVQKSGNDILEKAFADIRDLVSTIYLVDTKGDLRAVAGEPKTISPEFLAMDVPEHKIRILTSRKLTQQFLIVGEPVLEKGKVIGAVRAALPMENLNKLVETINRVPHAYSLILDQDMTIVSHIFSEYNAQQLKTVFRGNGSEQINIGLNQLLLLARTHAPGVCIIDFPSEEHTTRIVQTIAALAPVQVHEGTWSLAVFWEYHSIAGPMIRNGLYNIFLILLTILLFALIFGIILRMRRKVWDLEVQEITSKIINKQLRSDIERHQRTERHR